MTYDLNLGSHENRATDKDLGRVILLEMRKQGRRDKEGEASVRRH